MGIVLSKELKDDLISVSRKRLSDAVMSSELRLEDMVINIMCANAPQVWRMKNKHFGNMDQQLSLTHDVESVIVGGYLN